MTTTPNPAALYHEPVLDKAQRALTLKNYRQYVHDYALECARENPAIADYNLKVQVFINQNSLDAMAEKHRQTFRSNYDSYSCRLTIAEYNEKIEAYNQTLGMPLLEKKPFFPIKQQHEETFETILFLYSLQLEERNHQLSRLAVHFPRPLQKAKISSHALEKYQANGIRRLRYTEKTIRNHITRLRDAGILKEYQYRGSARPVEYLLNSSVLSIIDASETKKLSLENQSFINDIRKILHNKHVVSTRAENKEKINNVVNVVKKGRSPAAMKKSIACGDNYQNSYQNTHRQKEEKTQGGAAPILRYTIEETGQLCRNMSQHTYNDYELHIGHEQLEREAMYGSMTSGDFRLFLLQEFLKIAAAIWAKKDVFKGCFANAWHLLNEHYLINPNGSVPSKINLLYQFNNLVYRVRWARKFYKQHPQYQPLYPSDYFDPTRKTKESGGFGYTMQKLIAHKEYIAAKEKRKEQLYLKATDRSRRLTAQKKVQNKVSQYVNGAVSLPQLLDYINQNPTIPHSFTAEIPYYIEKINNERFLNK